MDPLSIHKIQAVSKFKKQQLVTNLVLYTLTALTSSLFCSGPFWYPPLRAAVNVFLYISLPKIISLFFSSKAVFIVGNLIVIYLVGEFKIFTVPPHPSPDYNDEFVGSSKILQSSNKKKSSKEEKVKVNNYKDGGGGHREINVREQVARFKGCESQNKDSLFVGVHNYEKLVMVGSEPKGPTRVTPRDGDILGSKERNRREEKMEDWRKTSDDGEELSLAVKDLNRMADDFIARVNKQRRLEDEFSSIVDK